jgi:hypothetical protein
MKTVVELAFVIILPLSALTSAQTCNFKLSGTTMTLAADCTTAAAITIPDGFTLNGDGHLITAVDPGNGQFFSGPILTNAGATASVKNLLIDTPAFSSCGPVSQGIAFNGASGSITGNTILHIGTQYCTTAQNTGILLTSSTSVIVSSNRVIFTYGPALSASGGGTVNVTGNEFSTSLCCGTVVYLSGIAGSFANNSLDSDAVYQTALRLENTAPGFKVLSNNINLRSGAAMNSGIYVGSDATVINGNRVFNWYSNPTGATGINNVGVANSASNKITNNEVSCYGMPFANMSGNRNTVLTCPWQ